MIPMISQAADDLIVASEVSSRSYYEKNLRRPEFPGASSGVTWAIGYDGGQASPNKIKSDWGDRVPGAMVDAMVSCSGITGAAAKAYLPKVRNLIDVPWDQAILVYENIDIPQWTARVCRSIPGAEKLPPDCLGAITSTAYNRGNSFQTAGDRYREMRAIRSHIIAGELDQVDDELRSMKRLWPDLRGLQIRRDKEADLWNAGLKAPSTTVVKSRPSETPPPLVAPSTSKTAENATAGGGLLTTAEVAHQSHASGLSPWLIGGIVVGGIVLSAGLAAYVKARKAEPVLARAKG